MNIIKIIIVSQQSLFRQGVENLLSRVKDIEISSNTSLTRDVLSTIDMVLPDVALVDIDGPTDEGFNLARRMRQLSPSIAVIVLTSDSSDSRLFQALKAQASAFLSKEVTADQLVAVVKRVAAGEHPINESLTTNPKLAEKVLNQFQKLTSRGETETFISPLTSRETEILTYIAQGFLNKQIAIKLGISEQTIKNHITAILRKLNANARTEAVVVAIKQGLISID